MGLFEGLQNLFRGISKGRSDDSDTLPVVSSVGSDESDGTLRFTVADGQMQVDMIWNLLTEQIGECRNQQLPKPLPNPDDLFRPTLIGAWAEDRLVGGAFVMPDLEDSAYYAAAGHGDAAEFLAVRTAMVQGIAVSPECRRMGVGAEIKRHCGLWAAQHGCVLVLSVVTNDAAARMNEKPAIRFCHRWSRSSLRRWITAGPSPSSGFRSIVTLPPVRVGLRFGWPR